MTDEGPTGAPKPSSGVPKKRRSRKQPQLKIMEEAAKQALQLERSVAPISDVAEALRRSSIGPTFSAEEARRLSEIGPVIKGATLTGLAASLGIGSKIRTDVLGLGPNAAVDALGGMKSVLSSAKAADLLGNIPKSAFGGSLAGLGVGKGTAFDPTVVRQSYAEATAVITKAAQEHRASQDRYRDFVREQSPIVGSLTTPTVLATQRVEEAVLSLDETMGTMLDVTKALLKVSEDATLSAGRSNGNIGRLTRVLVLLTGVLVLPIVWPLLVDFVRDWVVPFYVSLFGAGRDLVDVVGRAASSMFAR